MDIEEFRKRGVEMVDYVIDYFESLAERSVVANAHSGDYLRSVSPSTAPTSGESVEKIMQDVEKYIMPGLTHWHHPGFHAYLPSNGSYPAILGTMLADTLGFISFNWEVSPSGNELEVILLNWLGEMVGLPNSLLRLSEESKGAGAIHKSTSECIFISLITARQTRIRNLLRKNPSISSSVFRSTLVAYCSEDSHYHMESVCRVALIILKSLHTDEELRLRGETLDNAIKEDIKRGLIPFFVCITLGTSIGSCDALDEIGPICKQHGIWLHVDGAYAGAAMICPEYKYLLKGMEHASAFSINPAKWLLVPFDCTVFYVTNRYQMIDSVIADKTRFGYNFHERDWGYPGKTEFQSIKLYFVIKMYGLEGLQKHIRNHVRLAKMFKDYVRKDERFEVITCYFGLVCFRLLGSNNINSHLLDLINCSGKLFMASCDLHEKLVLRFVVCTEQACDEDIIFAWEIISECADKILKMNHEERESSSVDAVWHHFEFKLP